MAEPPVQSGTMAGKGRVPAKETRPEPAPTTKGTADMDSLAAAAIDLLRAHREATDARTIADERLALVAHRVVALARQYGIPWQTIADELGLPSAEAARVRHHRGA